MTVAAASYAMSGFTLMDQGKTLSDVVLSAAMDQDCAMWRIVQDEPICVDENADGDVVAESDDESLPPSDDDWQVAEVAGKAPKSFTSN